MIWAALVLGVVAAACVAWPLIARDKGITDRSDAALAIFKDQLSEVDRDAARDQISGAEAQAARTEIKRRMLSASRQSQSIARGGGGWVVVVAALLVPLGGAGIYTLKGSPTTPSLPFAERSQEQGEAQELQDLVTTLRKRLDDDPEGGEARGWELLATTYMNMNRFRDAAYSWSQIVDRDAATSGTWSQYAESLIADANGTITPRAQDAIKRALELDTSNPAGTYYNALAMDQVGQGAGARRLLLERIAAETQVLPWMDVFLIEANRIGEALGMELVGLPDFGNAPRGPTQEDVEAASEMSDEDQQEFIRSMVNRLADRLSDAPDDLQGWLQLARAYMVLEQPEDALAALKSAEPFAADLAKDNPLRQALEAGLEQLGG